jgi:hypothetical protein
VSVVKRKPIVIAGALGLVLGIAAQAAGAPGHAPADHHAGARPDDRPTLAVFEKPDRRFHRSLEIARRKARRDQAAQASDGNGASAPAGSVPSPESVGISATTLESIAACESGGDPSAVSADGSYRGKYQFDYGTWASVGGSGDPAAAPEAEQDYRAALLYSRGGSSPWPICGS